MTPKQRAAYVAALIASAGLGYAAKPTTVPAPRVVRTVRTVLPVAKDATGKIIGVGEPVTYEKIEPERNPQ